MPVDAETCELTPCCCAALLLMKLVSRNKVELTPHGSKGNFDEGCGMQLTVLTALACPPTLARVIGLAMRPAHGNLGDQTYLCDQQVGYLGPPIATQSSLLQ